MAKSLLVALTLFSSACLFAQQGKDSLRQLSPVNIEATRVREFTIGMKSISIDSLTLSQQPTATLSDLLAGKTAVYVKTYGQGSLAIASFRGTSANHTGIFWNGFSINPPNIDQSDLSLIPSSFFNSVEVLFGGASSLFGSGNIGGSIHLKNQPLFDGRTHVQFSATAGSFHNYSSQLRVTVSGKNLESITCANFNSFKNDFPYKDLYHKEKHQENAELSQTGVLQEVHARFKGNQKLIAALWYQYSDRNLPSSLTMSLQRQYQLDKSVRASLQWEKIYQKGVLRFRTAGLDGNIHFVQDLELTSLDVVSNIHTKTSSSEIEAKRNFGQNTKLNAGVSFQYTTADILAYNQQRYDSRAGFFLSASRYFPVLQWTANINLRQEAIKDFQAPFCPSLGLEGKLFPELTAKLNLSHNFRTPTLNDRYWQPGGNPDLKPENSWNAETGLQYHPQWRNTQTEFTITAFYSLVDKWIIWLPQSSGIWIPENMQKVESKGLEVAAVITRSFSEWKIDFSASYTYTEATNRQKTSALDDSYNKQLIYTPYHTALAEMQCSYKSYYAIYRHSYTGIRYITRDNTEELPAYTLANIFAGKHCTIGKQDFTFQLELNNLCNEEYQAIEYRPMPGRAFKVSIIWNFTGKTINKSTNRNINY